MKKLILGVAALMALTFTACDDDDPTRLTATFEDVILDSTGYWNGGDNAGKIVSADVNFTNTYTSSDWGESWGGFAVSNHIDTITTGYTNPYSCIAASGANGLPNFAVYYSSSDSVKFNSPVDMESVMLCNNTYAYLSMTYGDTYAKKFGGADGTDEDYFKLTITLYNANNAELGSEDFYLADFRGDADYIIKDWTKLDLSTYNGVSYMKFGFESTDMGDWGMNTPAYFCLDNVSYYTAE